MKKYLTIFSISWQSNFTYRLNFILWRVRVLLTIITTYFLWKTMFSGQRFLFGYTESQMISYIFLVLVVQAIVLSSLSADNIGSEIAEGDLSNYLVKPINYLRYWFTRDIADKLLNVLFSALEFSLLFYFFKPNLYLPANPQTILAFMAAITGAVVIYFFLGVATRSIAFWAPENHWTVAFLFSIVVEFLAGSIFPLNILPTPIYLLLQLTPFPYLIYFPIGIFLGNITGFALVAVLLQYLIWIVLLYFLVKLVWQKGILNYAASGR